MLTFDEIEGVYEVSFKKIKLGELARLEDGVYYYFPSVIRGAISGWVLLEIYQKLKELNNDYEKMLNNYIN